MSRRRAKAKNKLRRTSEGYVLDQFSQANLQQWNKFSKSLDEYHIRLFYHLACANWAGQTYLELTHYIQASITPIESIGSINYTLCP